MTAEQQIKAWLTADATVSGLVGDRVTPMYSPNQDKLPVIAYRRTSTEPQDTMHSTPTDELATFEFWGMANRVEVGDLIARAVQAVLVPEGFVMLDMTHQYDPEYDIYATVLTMDAILETN